ncbi:CBS domain-containing protein [Patescibacteria group bacterium]|nr:CBS domain-containing protein [Patescibacteria group bacterium]MBU2260063.1 CBS domain-containing protein [Patescibacteria group bacterium]
MNSSELSKFTILPTATLLEAAKTIESNTSRTVVVVEDHETNKVLGILSEGDILRSLIQGVSVHSSIGEYMKASFKYFEEGEVDMIKARELFTARGFGLIPVVDKNMHLISVVTMLDCLRNS